jgi:hypothetical protein
MPAKRAAMPTTFWSRILAAADIQSADRINWLVSSMKAENVVKAPMNPTSMTVWVTLDTGWRLSNNAQTRPSMKHPFRLTAGVPQGKAAPLIL